MKDDNIITEEDFPIKQVRRAEKREKKRRAMPKHSKFLGEIYAEAWKKRIKDKRDDYIPDDNL